MPVATESTILMYHSLDASGSVISIAPEVFRLHMSMLKESGAPVAPLSEVHRTPGAFAITFDDGFCSFADTAVPVLQSYHFPATVFAVSGYCGKFNDWQPQRGIARQRLMSWSELRQLTAEGIEIGAHTVNHPNLLRLPAEQAAAELRDSRARLCDELGRPVTAFAYPYGQSNATLRDVARKYFRMACGTGLASVTPESDSFNLPRIDAYYLRRPAIFEKFVGGARGYIAVRRLFRSLRAAIAV
jgi:peptidoglycan/xylan/chitin deacetylase (PgdA/CDA1 family)